MKKICVDIDGVICTNTTIDKSNVEDKYKNLQGGLSGKPLFDKSNTVLKNVKNHLSDGKTIIGVGGINSASSANEKLNLGADLLQLYTGLVYKGPALINDIFCICPEESILLDIFVSKVISVSSLNTSNFCRFCISSSSSIIFLTPYKRLSLNVP